MEVSFDSPEAFEEVIWLSYLKEKYVTKDRLIPLTLKNTSKAFADKLSTTLKKLILEASKSEEQQHSTLKRYISKNNANCARIPVLTKLFPKATILIPFREPLAHIGSLMKQHQQFTEMHKNDKFARNYMQWLGHYDFGENFKPIDFDHWLDSIDGPLNFGDENFWLQYWIAGYSNMLKQVGRQVHLVDYNKMLEKPEQTLTTIAELTKLKAPIEFIKNAREIRSPTSKPRDSVSMDQKLLEKANQLYKELQSSAL